MEPGPSAANTATTDTWAQFVNNHNFFSGFFFNLTAYGEH